MPCRVRAATADQTWHYSVPGAAQPDWAQHFVDAVIDPIRNLKEKVGEELRLVLWSDCIGKCTEGTAGERVADVLMKTAGIKFTLKLYAGSDCTRHCMKFVSRHHTSQMIFSSETLMQAHSSARYVGMHALYHLLVLIFIGPAFHAGRGA